MTEKKKVLMGHYLNVSSSFVKGTESVPKQWEEFHSFPLNRKYCSFYGNIAKTAIQSLNGREQQVDGLFCDTA